MKRYLTSTLVLLTILSTSLAGGIWGGRAQANSKSSEETNDLIKTYAEVLNLAEENYAEKIDSQKVVFDSIRDMLKTLDPHSNFFDPKQFAQFREEQRGNFYGLGITIAIRNAKPTVVSPIPGTPAYRLGVRSGDIIAKIEGKSTDGLSIQEVVDQLRGPKGTTVNIHIQREGISELIPFSIVRDEIPRYSVPYAFFLQPKVGYIKIDSFTETTEKEITTGLKNLGSNLDGLILDLRSNPGGYLQAAIAVADKFLKGGQDVLVTKGRLHNANHRYPVPKGTDDTIYPLVVLINGGSASASEIVAGAIQDHDRGLILGERSFGKGLVQTVFPLNQGAGLSLTTAKWYTPSGRLIQRDYTNKSFFDYYRNKEADNPPTETRFTDSGREVTGGGGITPDVKVENKFNKFQTMFLSRGVFFTFIRAYAAKHPDYDPKFLVSDNLLNEFRMFLNSEANNKIEYEEKDWLENLDFVKREIKYEYVLAHTGSEKTGLTLEDAQKVHLEGDTQVIKALESLPQAKALYQNAIKALAAKTGGARGTN